MRTRSLQYILLFVLGTTILGACKKTEPLVISEEMIHFANITPSAIYSVLDDATPYEIKVGTTNVPNRDVNFTYTITSPTGAVEGTHFTIQGAKNRSIESGSAITNIVLQGNYSIYEAGTRKDTLVFRITSADIDVAPFDSSFTLIIKGPCTETDVFLEELAGDYDNVVEDGSYFYSAPVTISSVTHTSASTGTAVIGNLYDSGISATVEFDWSTPGNYTVTIPPQATGFTAGGLPLSVVSTPNTTSLFAFCANRMILYVTLYTSAGAVASFEMDIAR